MVRRPLLTLCAVIAVACVACSSSGDDDAAESPSGTVATAAPETTTTTMSVEDEVEEAYLRSWEVYADAVLTFDTSQLEDVYVGDALALRRDEIARLKEANTPARVDVEHDITIEIADAETAIVFDDYFNRSVLIDASTGDAIEDVPNEVVSREYHLRLIEGTWKVAFATGR